MVGPCGLEPLTSTVSIQKSELDGESGNGKRLSFHLFRVDRLIQLPYGLARPDLERIRRFRRETVKGGLNMRKESDTPRKAGGFGEWGRLKGGCPVG
jgi:hypothetical protein